MFRRTMQGCISVLILRLNKDSWPAAQIANYWLISMLTRYMERRLALLAAGINFCKIFY
jgi:hypothetical protein